MLAKLTGWMLLGLVRLLTGAQARWFGCPPKAEQRIYFANHQSHVDLVMIWAALPEELRSITRPIAARDYWANTPLKRWITTEVFNAVYVERAGGPTPPAPAMPAPPVAAAPAGGERIEPTFDLPGSMTTPAATLPTAVSAEASTAPPALAVAAGAEADTPPPPLPPASRSDAQGELDLPTPLPSTPAASPASAAAADAADASAGAMPLPELRPDDPLLPLVDALRSGDSIIIFPEGTRGHTGTPQKFKSGLYMLARLFPEVVLVPAWIDNVQRVMPKGEVVPVPILCSVTFGAPLKLGAGEERRAFLDRAREAVVALRDV
ncbi:MAG: 1-acyl-sn-glycerol-3-phosphate acyltransferase [Rhodocyclaceae bacterium]|nr:1-acyl-sn-glycerol-3-phosphate acyltransferase [Rhodocyclaceae bacterium]